MVIYPNDHRPPHVHLIGQGHEAIFELNALMRSVELRQNFGFARRELGPIQTSLLAKLRATVGRMRETSWTGVINSR